MDKIDEEILPPSSQVTNEAVIPEASTSSTPSSLDYCFICLCELQKPVHPINKKVEEADFAKDLKKNIYHVALKYLIHSCDDEKEKIERQLQLIHKLLGVLKAETCQETSFSLQESLCSACEKKFKEIIKLHRKLEVVQIQLRESIKAIEEIIIGSSVYGANDATKRRMEELESWLQNQESDLQMSGNEFIKKKREWLQTLLEFQIVIFEKSEGKNEKGVCSLFQKCLLTPATSASSAFYSKNGGNDKNLVSLTADIDSYFENEASTSSQNQGDISFGGVSNTTDFDFSSLVKTEFEENEDDRHSVGSLNLDLNQFTPEIPSLVALDVLNSSIIPVVPVNSVVCKENEELVDKRRTRSTRRSQETYNLSDDSADEIVPQKKTRRKKGKAKQTPAKSQTQPVLKRKKRLNTGYKQNPHRATRLSTIIDKDKRCRVYKCDICSYSVHNMYNFIQHLRTHETDEKNFECEEEFCEDRKFTGAQFFQLHELQHKELQYQWRCKICSKRIPPPAYKKHLEGHGTLPVHKCEHCYFASTSVVELVNHFKHHFGTTRKCIFCPGEIQRVIGQSSYAQHLHKEHGCDELVVKCDFEGCSETFYSTSAMHMHKNVHLKKYTCTQCGHSFTNSSGFKMHMQQKHTKEKVHSCTVSGCTEAFVTHSQLERHLVNQHNRPKYKCFICPDKEYSNVVSLRAHERRHHRENMYTCDICGKVFKNLAYCNKHKTIHGPRNAICEVCGFATTSQYQLQKHKVIHKEIPLHGCPHCSKRFHYRRAMEDHIRTHTGDRPFVCHYCSAAFAQKGAMTNHIRRLHEKDNRPRKWNTIKVKSVDKTTADSLKSCESSSQSNARNKTSQSQPITTSDSITLNNELLQQSRNDNSFGIQDFDGQFT